MSEVNGFDFELRNEKVYNDNVDWGIFTDIVHLDFSKVFDRAPHYIFAWAKLYWLGGFVVYFNSRS